MRRQNAGDAKNSVIASILITSTTEAGHSWRWQASTVYLRSIL
ncbi:hypothetical protein O9993_18705 [Vibrio lentus]|nr:hypothetical protein [Vibrio lentus]